MDITKCKGEDCPIKESCKRFTPIESMMESYFIESPIEDGKCEMYCKNLDYDFIKNLKN